MQRCTTVAANVFSYATQDRASGPNVVLNHKANGTSVNLQPHQRWATGVLMDGVQTPTGGIDLMNRGWDGSGHGWAIGFGVVWNSVASGLLIQQPPGAQNWAIGTSGTYDKAAAPGSASGAADLPEGIVDSPAVMVAPRSLYLEQLCERLGPAEQGDDGQRNAQPHALAMSNRLVHPPDEQQQKRSAAVFRR